jgi:hypothetical protein
MTKTKFEKTALEIAKKYKLSPLETKILIIQAQIMELEAKAKIDSAKV